MTCPGIAESSRRRLLAWLDDDRPNPETLVRRLRELRRIDDVPAFSSALRLLAHVDVSEPAAEGLVERILAHRRAMAERLGRDPGLRVALMDFLHNIEPRMTHPIVVERSRLEETERSAMTDSLTGLYNRRFFRSSVEREIRRGRRYGTALSLVLLDLDGFKEVNDAFGHLFGDLVLRRVARLVRRAVRESDTPCRYGGDEFAVVLPETDPLGAYALADRIRARVESAFLERPTGGRSVAMALSGGVASCPEDGATPQALIAAADAALYRAKELGKNRIALDRNERRCAVRFPARPGARIELAREPGSPGGSVVALNLSRFGALVETAEPWRPREPVRVRLTAGHGMAARRWVAAGRVVRVQDGTAIRRVGIAFDNPIPDACLRAHTLPGGVVRKLRAGEAS